MDSRQENQHIVITGGGSGIGRAIAIRLAQEGAKVTLLSRNLHKLQKVVQKITELGGTAQCFACDIQNSEQIAEVMAVAVDNFGNIRAMIANSGVGGANFPGEEDRFDEIVQTNLYGTYYSIREAQKYLMADALPSHILVVSSCLARFGVPGYTAYCASKAGLLGLVRALALELADQNTQVNAICPGWVETDMAWEGLQGMADGMGISLQEAHKIAMKAVPLKRMSQPEEIAGTVAWLLSEDAYGVTGQGIDINAGSWMG
jgi:NAD(P)-dependent dehydrogenase (short-subunit alcohol dehydrogenase family)